MIPEQPPGACVVLEYTRDDDKPVWKVSLPHFIGVGTDIVEKVDAIRRAKQRDREEFIGFQKECGGRGDRDGAKFFKGEAADAMKEYRAACLVLGYYAAEPPGDSPFRRQWDWPVELAPWVDRIVWAISA